MWSPMVGCFVRSSGSLGCSGKRMERCCLIALYYCCWKNSYLLRANGSGFGFDWKNSIWLRRSKWKAKMKDYFTLVFWLVGWWKKFVPLERVGFAKRLVEGLAFCPEFRKDKVLLPFIWFPAIFWLSMIILKHFMGYYFNLFILISGWLRKFVVVLVLVLVEKILGLIPLKLGWLIWCLNSSLTTSSLKVFSEIHFLITPLSSSGTCICLMRL